jgi:hypothetical protein
MELLGAANWWLPGWLDRLLPGSRRARSSRAGYALGAEGEPAAGVHR